MKPFHFSLESLRVLRQQKERAAQQRYAATLTTCHEAERQLQRATTELALGWNLLGRELEHGIVAGRLASFRTWCKALENRWNERKAVLDAARRAAELAFQEMTFAARDREALDRFHDKSRRAHDHQVQREEQKIFDELAVQLNGSPGPLQFTGHQN
jgi:flagellar export protein FliJ